MSEIKTPLFFAYFETLPLIVKHDIQDLVMKLAGDASNPIWASDVPKIPTAGGASQDDIDLNYSIKHVFQQYEVLAADKSIGYAIVCLFLDHETFKPPLMDIFKSLNSILATDMFCFRLNPSKKDGNHWRVLWKSVRVGRNQLPGTTNLNSIFEMIYKDLGREANISSQHNSRKAHDDPENLTAVSASTQLASKSSHIFISYSREDWDSYVERLAEHLTKQGFNIWIAQHLLEGGQDWLDEINIALRESRVMLLCLSPDALKSKYVKMEYRYFFDEDKPIVPILCREVDRVDIPAELRRIQYQPYDLEKIAARLRRMVGGE